MSQPPYPPLNEDQQKAVDAANKIVAVLNDPRTERAASTFGLGGAFFAKGTANYSTADFTKVVAVTVATTLPRLLASQGTDATAWIQLGVGLYKAFTSAAKALSTLVKNDVVYEALYRDYPFLTYTCNNNKLDFQNLLTNCATARRKAIDILDATKNDHLFIQKLYCWLYLEFGTLRNGDTNYPTLFVPNVTQGKCERTTMVFVNDAKSVQIAQFLGMSGRYAGQFNLPFFVDSNVCDTSQILASARLFVSYYQNGQIDADFDYLTIMLINAGFPNPETLRDENRANNYFFESFRTAAKKLEAEKLAKEQQEAKGIINISGGEQESSYFYYYLFGFIGLLLAIYYFFFSKK